MANGNGKHRTAAATKASAENSRKHRRSEYDFLRAVVDEFSADDAREVMEALKHRAKEGDAQAMLFLGKYLFGGGRIPLSELNHPSMIRRAR